jgi:S-DNA-T family DNA segregation ATPase FtsK/SpoIIIE
MRRTHFTQSKPRWSGITSLSGSTSILQRRLKIGYGRAARIIDQLNDAGVLGPPDGSRPREVLRGLESLSEL